VLTALGELEIESFVRASVDELLIVQAALEEKYPSRPF
jgi:hypothetical protein